MQMTDMIDSEMNSRYSSSMPMVRKSMALQKQRQQGLQKRNDNVSVFKYIASQNSNGANSLLAKYGVSNGKSDKEIAYKLAVLVKKGGEDALKKVMDLHPDKEYLSKKEDKFRSMCGCSVGADGFVNCCGVSNADGSFSCEGNPNCDCHLKKMKDAKLSAEGEEKPVAPIVVQAVMPESNSMLKSILTPMNTTIMVSAFFLSVAIYLSRSK